ncbi:MAG TPA: zf-HC2 domain-containing protein [Marmoricola sp.]|nr:zf-HC2 domain-containing protein [Marmoricola sp.]
MILKLHGHIGSSASALVDGQLSAAEEERAWAHILGCPGCRRLVEREGWIKQRIAGLAGPGVLSAPPSLLGNLYDVNAWAAVDEIERRSARRRATVALVGAGSVGVAVLALVTMTTPPAGRGEVPGQGAPAMIGNGLPRNAPGTGLSADIENAAFGGRSR